MLLFIQISCCPSCSETEHLLKQHATAAFTIPALLLLNEARQIPRFCTQLANGGRKGLDKRPPIQTPAGITTSAPHTAPRRSTPQNTRGAVRTTQNSAVPSGRGGSRPSGRPEPTAQRRTPRQRLARLGPGVRAAEGRASTAAQPGDRRRAAGGAPPFSRDKQRPCAAPGKGVRHRQGAAAPPAAPRLPSPPLSSAGASPAVVAADAARGSLRNLAAERRGTAGLGAAAARAPRRPLPPHGGGRTDWRGKRVGGRGRQSPGGTGWRKTGEGAGVGFSAGGSAEAAASASSLPGQRRCPGAVA